MDLQKYKEKLQTEIVSIFDKHGIRATCRATGMAPMRYYQIKKGEIAHAETLEKYLATIKSSLHVT
ncbi:MAG: hypothetical protein ACK5FG_00395 [Chryseotalea sp.]|jgi:hypothetical protein